jgi:CubicO group peptidase (beta-lactamase class C family)
MIAFDTRFNLASLGKLLTKIAVTQLVAQGKLSLDAKVGVYLPDYPNRDVREKVTIRHLLEFQTGLPEIWNERFFQDSKRVNSLNDYVALIADKPLKFEPGTQTEYSSSAYVLLGRIVEQVSGLSYPDFVQRYIAKPAGMTATGFDRAESIGPGTATGYKPAGMSGPQGGPQMIIKRGPPPAGMGKGGVEAVQHSPANGPGPGSGGQIILKGPPTLADMPVESNAKELPGRGSSAGGGYSNVPDFIKLDRALRDGVLVPRDRIGDVLGKGFAEGNSAAALAGGFPGVSTVAVFKPDGTTIIAFGNRNFPEADEVAKILAERFARN